MNKASALKLVTFCNTPARASRAADKVQRMAERADDRDLQRLSDLLSERRHLLRSIRCNDHAGVIEHARKQNAYWRELGI